MIEPFKEFGGGYYDPDGNWVRTKFCFVACPPDVCNCFRPSMQEMCERANKLPKPKEQKEE